MCVCVCVGLYVCARVLLSGECASARATNCQHIYAVALSLPLPPLLLLDECSPRSVQTHLSLKCSNFISKSVQTIVCSVTVQQLHCSHNNCSLNVLPNLHFIHENNNSRQPTAKNARMCITYGSLCIRSEDEEENNNNKVYRDDLIIGQRKLRNGM